MHMIVCLDQRDGMLFGGRRQSRDREVCSRMLERAAESCLWMNEYSARIFPPDAPVQVDEAFLAAAQEGEFCFVENADLTAVADRVESITVYRWQKVYPADVRFPWELFPRHRLVRTTEFSGFSHEQVLEEVYE